MKRIKMSLAEEEEEEEEEFDVALTLSIFRVEDIENPICGFYGVIWWVEPGEEHRSQVVSGKPNPIWNLKWTIQLRNLAEPKFVNLELIRYVCTNSEPGTSTGYAAVSRARVPLPKKTNTKKEGKFGLVRIQGPGEVKPEGQIIMSMHLFKI